MQIRINKFLSLCGIGSRRKIEEMLWQSEFQINGRTAIPGEMIDTDKDIVEHFGKTLKPVQNFIYLALNKPKGIVSTTSDEKGRKTIMDLIKSKERLYPVGRLDKESTGLILLTNDGDLALKLTHPRYHLPKTYEVTTYENISDDQILKMSQGIKILGTRTLPAEIKRKGNNFIEIILHQGMKRQIREMCKAVGLNVKTLHRISIGPIKIGNLETGKYRELNSTELTLLR